MVHFIKPYKQDPFVGHLQTPITTSAFTRSYLRLLPAYRPGLTPFLRGVEIGFTHGYFLIGPFYTFGPLRSAEFSVSSLGAAFLATITLEIILTVASSLYGQVTYEVYENPLAVKVAAELFGSSGKTARFPKVKGLSDLDCLSGWQKFSEGFLAGGLFGTTVAAVGILLYANPGALLELGKSIQN